MGLINPELQLPNNLDPQLRQAITKAWREAVSQINNLFTIYHQSSKPVIPDGVMSLWHDTANSKYYLVANFGQGVIKTVEMT